MHQDTPANTTGRDFVMGDLHGCYDLLMDSLAYEGFDRRADRLFSVGDIIDRGPDSAKCLELIDEPWFYMVRGNHEQMMIDAVLHGEGLSWGTEYGRWAMKLSDMEQRVWATRLADTPLSMTLDCGDCKVGLCHAEPPGYYWPDVKLPSFHAQMLWGRRVLRKLPKQEVCGIDITIHGHTPLDQPQWIGNRYFMDTGAWFSGSLTLRRIEDIWQDYHARTLI